MQSVRRQVVGFEGYTLDLTRGCIRGANGEIELRPKSFELLCYLVGNAGRLVPKDELVNVVWPNIIVSDDSLARCVSDVRHALNDPDRQIIKTVPRRGYLFAAPVTISASEAVPPLPVVTPPRLSIIVMPFTNLSNDPDQDYFADGITDDLTTDLTRISDSFVIACSTAFTYRGKAVEAKQVGRDLGVRYLLEGSVRRSGHQVRANAHLIDADSGAHLWADRFDCDTGDLFALQDKITSRIAVALSLELISAEAARPAEHPDALDYILRGRSAYSKPLSRDRYAEAISLFEHALTRDPRSIDARSWLATVLEARMDSQMTDTRAADIARAEGLIAQALAASPRSPQAHFAKGQGLHRAGRHKEAIPEFETAIAFNRNWAFAISSVAEIGQRLGWLPHTVRAAITGLRHAGREVTRRKDTTSQSVYRLTPVEIAPNR
jgi:TolB-like protein